MNGNPSKALCGDVAILTGADRDGSGGTRPQPTISKICMSCADATPAAGGRIPATQRSARPGARAWLPQVSATASAIRERRFETTSQPAALTDCALAAGNQHCYGTCMVWDSTCRRPVELPASVSQGSKFSSGRRRGRFAARSRICCCGRRRLILRFYRPAIARHHRAERDAFGTCPISVDASANRPAAQRRRAGAGLLRCHRTERHRRAERARRCEFGADRNRRSAYHAGRADAAGHSHGVARACIRG